MWQTLLARVTELIPPSVRERMNADPEPWWMSWAWVIGLILVIGLLAALTR